MQPVGSRMDNQKVQAKGCGVCRSTLLPLNSYQLLEHALTTLDRAKS